MIERTLWHPVLETDALGADVPCTVRLLDDDLVLWRDATGAPQAWVDRCPHRGARLSLGRVVAGTDGSRRLECAYHGWQFGASGRCLAIPALPDFVPPPGHGAATFEACEAHGLVWVRLQGGDSVLPAFPAEHDAALRKLLCGPYRVEASAPRIVENFLDLAHFGFVHEGWLGDRAHTALDAHTLAPTPTGFVATGCRAATDCRHRAAGSSTATNSPRPTRRCSPSCRWKRATSATRSRCSSARTKPSAAACGSASR
jgi:phenylpropionate dioxygenase-like ring-hydroxylating dioxygenase large terminal subunit